MKKAFIVTMVAALPLPNKVQISLKDADREESDMTPSEKIIANLEKYRDKMPPEIMGMMEPFMQIGQRMGEPITILILSEAEYRKLGAPSVGMTVHLDIEVDTKE